MRWPVIPEWSSLRGLGNSGPAKLTILIPVIGYFIIFNENIINNVELTPALAPAGQLSPLSIIERLYALRIYFIYLGLSFVGVASILYQTRCPKIIKKYDDDEDFVANTKSNTTSRDALKYLKEIKASIDTVEGFNVELASSVLFPPGGVPHESEMLKDTIKTFYFILDRINTFSRAGAWVFYTIGFTLLSVPSVVVFIKVCQRLIIRL